MRLTYEQLMQDPEGLLRRIGERLALEPRWLDKLAVAVSRVRRNEYVRREEQIEGLKVVLRTNSRFWIPAGSNFRYESSIVRSWNCTGLNSERGQPGKEIEVKSDWADPAIWAE